MTLDVASARAAVSQAALARDARALREIADSLPPLAAYAYERHRARAFANALRGARDSAVAELCLGVAACPPTASTFVADSAQLRLLTGEVVEAPPAPPLAARIGPRVLLSGVAVAAAVAALALLPGRSLDEGSPEASGVTSPSRTTEPRVVVADRPVSSGMSSSEQRPAPDDGDDAAGAPTLVAAELPARSTAAGTASPRPAEPLPPGAAVTRRPPRAAPAPEPTPAPAPSPQPQAPPSPPVAAAAPAPAPAPAPTATPQPREQKGKALGRAQAPGRSKKAEAPPPTAPPTPAAPPAEAPAAGPPEEHPGRGQGRDDRGPRP